jgi:diguanylate cyclase (GGDEF)-like protein
MRIISSRLADTMRDLSGRSPDYDGITGLPKRDLFLHRARLALNEDKRRDKKSALIIIRFKDFDEIEAEHGAEARTDFIRSLSNRLKNNLRHSDIIGHVDGSGLGVIAYAGNSDPDTEVIVKKLTEVMSEPIVIEPQQLELGGSAEFDVYDLSEENLDKMVGAD